jgi:hypothetical protein
VYTSLLIGIVTIVCVFASALIRPAAASANHSTTSSNCQTARRRDREDASWYLNNVLEGMHIEYTLFIHVSTVCTCILAHHSLGVSPHSHKPCVCFFACCSSSPRVEAALTTSA